MILAIKGWPIPMLSDHKRENEGGGVVSSKIYRKTSWYDARVEIRPSLIQGGGMFARKPIQAGEIVAIVGGDHDDRRRIPCLYLDHLAF